MKKIDYSLKDKLISILSLNYDLVYRASIEYIYVILNLKDLGYNKASKNIR